MNQKLMNRLREQTVVICDTEGKHLGSGFFVTDKLVVTAAHCVYREKTGDLIQKFSLRRSAEIDYNGRLREFPGNVAFIEVDESFSQESRIPVGYCKNLNYGVPIDVYGYPELQPEGYSFSHKINQNFYKADETDGKSNIRPTIQCLVRNVEGALNSYEGLSGSPVVVQDCIVGMAVAQDEGGDEVNAILILDFVLIYEEFEKKQIKMREITLGRGECASNRNMPGKNSLYSQAWWIIKEPHKENKRVLISDRYSIVLATFLLGLEGGADIILASPWKCGVAEVLQTETTKYERKFPNWKGRQWIEYREGELPDWETLTAYSGVVISVSADHYNDNLVYESIIGQGRIKKDILVLWNIWSEEPQKAILQAVRASEQLDNREQKEVLTVFSSWEKEEAKPEELSHILLVHKEAYVWLEHQIWDSKDIRSFLLNLNAEETDALAWEVFQMCREGQRQNLSDLFECLWDMCSESVRKLIAFCEGGGEWANLLEVEPAVLKRWFSTVHKEECSRILPYLQKEPVLYWTAILSNPHCTGDVLWEWCVPERRALVQLVLNQGVVDCDDIELCEKARVIRKQIRPT